MERAGRSVEVPAVRWCDIGGGAWVSFRTFARGCDSVNAMFAPWSKHDGHTYGSLCICLQARTLNARREGITRARKCRHANRSGRYGAWASAYSKIGSCKLNRFRPL